jgi:hypothetical protein
MSQLRRRSWGALWAKAGWDGTAPVFEPLRIPNTTAAPLPQHTGHVRPRTLRMAAFGRLFVGLPWNGTPKVVATAASVNFDLPISSALEDSAKLSTAETLHEMIS